MKKLWLLLRGNKRNIGIIAGFVLRGITLFWPEALPTEQVQYINWGIDTFLVVGITDSIARGKVVNTAINKAKNFNKIKNKNHE